MPKKLEDAGIIWAVKAIQLIKNKVCCLLHIQKSAVPLRSSPDTWQFSSVVHYYSLAMAFNLAPTIIGILTKFLFQTLHLKLYALQTH